MTNLTVENIQELSRSILTNAIIPNLTSVELTVREQDNIINAIEEVLQEVDLND